MFIAQDKLCEWQNVKGCYPRYGKSTGDLTIENGAKLYYYTTTTKKVTAQCEYLFRNEIVHDPCF